VVFFEGIKVVNLVVDRKAGKLSLLTLNTLVCYTNSKEEIASKICSIRFFRELSISVSKYKYFYTTVYLYNLRNNSGVFISLKVLLNNRNPSTS